MTLPSRDETEVEALRTDRYIDALLAAHDRRATDAPAAAELDPSVREAARRLSRDLTRVHPSFRFEERLAQRLAQTAASMRLPAVAGGIARPVVAPDPLGRTDPLGGADPLDPLDDPLSHPLGADPGGRSGAPVARPLLIGGAMASAALSIAGAAYIAWRRNRPPLSPMARAVRAARQNRLGSRASGPLRWRLD